MRTKFCPHCCSEKIHRVEESDGSHFHECEECDETWEHHEKDAKPLVGSHDFAGRSHPRGPIRSNN